MKNRILYILLLATSVLQAQQPTPAAERQAGYEQRLELLDKSTLGNLDFTNIGPTVMSGRVTDLAVNPEDPTEFYVAYASGGLWHTTNNGISFQPLFQEEAVMTIGDVDVHWPTRTIYLGSGEVNSSRSSYAGNGIYKSTDGGKSWTHLGLEETHHIGRVIVDPRSPDTLWVAALGHLYGPNTERGVYKSTNGGKSWTKTLFVNERSGAIDLVQDPRQPNELFAATWERNRSAWDFEESGEGSGLWHSKDGGESWEPFAAEGSGFPLGEGTGRIGIDLYYTEEGERGFYVALDNYNRRPEEELEDEKLTTRQLKKMSAKEVIDQKDYVLTDFLRENGFPPELTLKKLRKDLVDTILTPTMLVEYLEDANRQLFDTPVIGLEVYRSTDEGKTWERTHEDYLDGVYNSYGYYFGQIRVNPTNPEQVYAMGVPIIRSDDGGKNWISINGDNVHADHHALWINPNKPGHLINGNDGGVNISYDFGEHWFKANTPAVGQFYAIAADDHPKGYRVYGGLQDNGTWRGPHDYEFSDRWYQIGKYPYEMIMGGDGMQVQVDPRDNETAYIGFQFGNYFRINPKSGDRKFIKPKHKLGERPLRWNWQTPIHLSIHQADVLYIGSNFFHRSLNRGEFWEALSPDLTNGGKKGDVPYGTLATIHESPKRFGLLYTGSDDGKVYCSRDGGFSWQDRSNGLPSAQWVSRVRASHHKEGRVYISLNGYRYDDFKPYVYVSEDYGETWAPIGSNLPAEPVNVIIEDPVNEDLLYVGTDHGLYISQDRGKRFQAVAKVPKVAVHDLVIQSSQKDLLVGTHGRSIYRADISALQQLGPDTDTLMVFTPDPVRASGSWGSESWWPRRKVEPSVGISVFSPTAGKAEVVVTLKGGPEVAEFSADIPAGLSSVSYDLTVEENQMKSLEEALNKDRKDSQRPVRIKKADNDKAYIKKGTYVLSIKVGDETEEVELVVK